MAGSAIPHRKSTDNNALVGLTFGSWWKLLRENRFRVSPIYWRRLAMLTITSGTNSILHRWERRHDDAIESTPINHAPVFILGHWRSGTTHLHNLLTLDQRFAFPTTYQALCPHTFLISEDRMTSMFGKSGPGKRPMDNVSIAFDSPQEDEMALALLCGMSPYLGFSFPASTSHYDRFLTFDDVPADQVARWSATLLWFCKKLTYKHGSRPLLLKSPGHTARIRLLLALFPGARFIHIHRHPHEVFRSFRHYHDTAAWFSYLQCPDRADIDDRIIRGYRTLYDAYFAQRGLIPPGNLSEVAFSDLEADPVGEIARIYHELNLPGFEALRGTLENAVTSHSGYQKNKFDPLESLLRERLASEWRPEFEEWGYIP